MEAGVSLGMIFPEDRLAETGDHRGAHVDSGPSLGARIYGNQMMRLGGARWLAIAEMSRLRSPYYEDLKVLCVPLQGGLSWELGAVERMSMHASLRAGALFVSTSMGEERSLTQGLTSLAWQMKRSLPDLSVALEMAVGLIWGDSQHRAFQIRLILLTG